MSFSSSIFSHIQHLSALRNLLSERKRFWLDGAENQDGTVPATCQPKKSLIWWFYQHLCEMLLITSRVDLRRERAEECRSATRGRLCHNLTLWFWWVITDLWGAAHEPVMLMHLYICKGSGLRFGGGCNKSTTNLLNIVQIQIYKFGNTDTKCVIVKNRTNRWIRGYHNNF